MRPTGNCTVVDKQKEEMRRNKISFACSRARRAVVSERDDVRPALEERDWDLVSSCVLALPPDLPPTFPAFPDHLVEQPLSSRLRAKMGVPDMIVDGLRSVVVEGSEVVVGSRKVEPWPRVTL